MRDDEKSLANTERRLRNWGAVYRGSGVPGYATPSYDQPDVSVTRDELDAADVEEVIVLLKTSPRAHRRYMYRVAWVRYIEDLPNQVAADAVKRSESQYRIDVGKLLAWVDGALESWRKVS